MNVLQILADQHAAHVMGCEGHRYAITPHLDGLAASGVRFRHAYCQNPICTPSRLSYLTGQYCQNHGHYGLHGPTPGVGAVPPLTSFLEHFRTHGYHSAIFGKIHLPDQPTPWWGSHVDEWAEAEDYQRWLAAARPQYVALEDSGRLPEFTGAQQLEGRPSSLPFDASIEGWTVQRAIAAMKRARELGKPFCMQVSFFRPHQCHTPDRRFWEMIPANVELPETFYDDIAHRPPTFRRSADAFRAGQFWAMETPGPVPDAAQIERVARRIWRGYLACVAHVDHAVGVLLAALEEMDLASNTVVTYGSDHGAYATAYGLPEKAPGICSEKVCRIPMLWRVPGIVGGTVRDELVESVDVASTLPGLCGLPSMDSVDGHNLATLLRGGGGPVRSAAITENVYSKAIRWGRWRLVHYEQGMFSGDDVGELYDLEADPHERHNLYREPAYTTRVAEGRRLLLDRLIATRRIVSMISRGGSAQVGEDGHLPNSQRDAWRNDWELANYV